MHLGYIRMGSDYIDVKAVIDGMWGSINTHVIIVCMHNLDFP